ncbi:MAG: serine/threonine-protein kinase, partial [Isosphaeraceae bacterium]
MAGDPTTPPERRLPRIGSYELLEPLGTGGMSSVFRARHLETGLEVAVKVLPRNLAKNPTVLQRFLREARSAEALQHPHIVAIYDRGQDQGRNYLVLEYVHGGDLHDRVRSEGPLPIHLAVSAIRQVAEGLRYAATCGVIHRDIKPANVLMTSDGKVKVIDLGLALQADDEDERVTREGTTVGTVDYMAPEQARDSRATSIRSDIYSLGCTFMFLLTGQPPFPGGDVAEKLHRHINVPPPDPRSRRPEIPDSLAQLVLKMLAKQPEARFSGYDELLDALGQIKTETSTAAPVQNAPVPVLFDDSDDEIALAPSDGGLPLAARGEVPLESPGDALPGMDAPESLLAGLADLEERSTRPLPLSRPRDGNLTPIATQGSTARVNGGRGNAPSPIELLDEPGEGLDDSGDHSAMPGHRLAHVEGRGMSDSEKSWVAKLVVGAVAFLVLVIAGDLLLHGSPGGVGSEDTASTEYPGAEAPGPAA